MKYRIRMEDDIKTDLKRGFVVISCTECFQDRICYEHFNELMVSEKGVKIIGKLRNFQFLKKGSTLQS